ncbi:MAG TPA: hypothetical protein VEB64_02945 [Azospirillaceae bacterium]|nr:hypothetical protein [Azospirillaceae bacterium]
MIFSRRLDLPLATDATGRFLAWIIALMVYLASLALAGALVLAGMADRWDKGLADTLTVQVMPLAGVPMSQRVDAAVVLLKSVPGVESAASLTPEDMGYLLEPWLGARMPADLPMPALIDVKLTHGVTVDVPALAARVAQAVPGATLDDHAAWLGHLLRMAGTMQAAAAAVVLLVGSAAVVAVVFTVRTGLAIHAKVVELLHLMGATDAYVADQFQHHVLTLAARGGGAGTTLALATLLAITTAAGQVDAGLLPTFSLAPLQWAALGLVPLAAVGLAAFTARWTVLRVLAQMP